MHSDENQPFDGLPAGTHELQSLLAAIVTNSDDAIVAKDLNGVVRSWNAGAQRIFGYTPQEMIGQSITRIIPPDRQHEEREILERLRAGQRIDHFETVRMRKDGRLIDVSVTISPIKDASGRVIGASKSARDISLTKDIEREKSALLESEQAARREAERIGRVKDEFLATLSHELRTPLNAILGWAQLLRAGSPAPQDLAQGLETIERNARIQTQLIEELLDVSRIVSGKVRLDVQRTDLVDVLNDAVKALAPAAEAKQIRLTKTLDPSAGPVTGDPARLQQIVWNLISNAIKFTPKGGQVQVFLQRVDSQIEIVVSDTGQGFSPEFIPHLFKRFSQADSTTSRRHAGLGLGLAIVRHLVELHGGTVRAHSPGVGMGATFKVSLPQASVREAPDPNETFPAGSKLGTSGLMDLRGAKVLIVDDEPDARDLVRRVLQSCNAKVVAAGSADEGLTALQRERPDVLLSDIGMPLKDGYDLLKRVRELPESKGGRTPAVALTAFARSEDRRRALLAGFQMHVPKPVEPAELIAVVANLAGVAGPTLRASDRDALVDSDPRQ